MRQSSSNYRASDTFGVSELELNVMRWPMNVRKVGRTMEGPVEVKIRSITLFLWGVFDAVFQLHRDVIHIMPGNACSDMKNGGTQSLFESKKIVHRNWSRILNVFLFLADKLPRAMIINVQWVFL